MVDVPEVLDLTAPQARVLGCLMEKQATTPDGYPLTLKALTTACNQSSNRNPVVDYPEQLVETTVLALKAKGLARVVHPGSGERATKYRHVADEALGLDAAQRAVLAVLLLRGAQTVAELLARTERLHRFGSADEVESVLDGLAGSPRPMVRRLERQPGQKEPRWLQLLEGNEEERASAAASGASAARSGGRGGQDPERIDQLERRLERVERQLAALTDALSDLVDLPPDEDPDDPVSVPRA